MSDHQLLILLVEAQQLNAPGHAFLPASTPRGEPFLFGLDGVHLLHVMQAALGSLRYQGFLNYAGDGSFQVNAAGIAYYHQITGQ